MSSSGRSGGRVASRTTHISRTSFRVDAACRRRERFHRPRGGAGRSVAGRRPSGARPARRARPPPPPGSSATSAPLAGRGQHGQVRKCRESRQKRWRVRSRARGARRGGGRRRRGRRPERRRPPPPEPSVRRAQHLAHAAASAALPADPSAPAPGGTARRAGSPPFTRHQRQRLRTRARAARVDRAAEVARSSPRPMRRRS